MYLLRNLIFVTFLLKTCYCETTDTLFKNINENALIFNQKAAQITWKSSINPGNTYFNAEDANYQKNIIIWRQSTCDKLATLFQSNLLNSTQKRQTYLLCRGPKFNLEEAGEISYLSKQLQDIYNAEICIPNEGNMSIRDVSDKESAIKNYLSSFHNPNYNFTEDQKVLPIETAINKTGTTLCIQGEKEFNEIMAFSKDEGVLKWIWLVWREMTGPEMKEPYKRLVDIENTAARRNGYQDIGASWRDEVEIPNLHATCRKLYESVRPLYMLLHGVVRFHLRQIYGDFVPEDGPIPAHLLGNLWSQDWEHLSNLMTEEDIDLDANIKKLNWTVTHMVKRAEDYYQSLGLPAMTLTFWRESMFSQENNAAKCHGAAADMFHDGDFRLLYCSKTTKDDFYVVHHELGHIQYYMAYEKQPTLLRQANTALHETIGDTIMYGVMTPQHLHRLGLLTDDQLYIKTTDETQNDNNDNFKSKFYTKKPIHKYREKTESTDDVIKMDNKKSYLPKWWKIRNYEFEANNNLKNQFKISDTDKLKSYKNFGLIYNNLNSLENLNNDKLKENVYLFHNIKLPFHKDLLLKKQMRYLENLSIKMRLDTDGILLLKQALNKIPQIPFGLLIDEYRWKYFEGSLNNKNDDFWKLSLELMGISPPNKRGEEYFDAGAKFHVPDNTPYIRYFLSNFLQHQLFESLCKTAVFGRRDDSDLPETIPLHRCDLYGSKAVGKALKDIMSRGHSEHWKHILQSTVNVSEISSSALYRYYRPLRQLLLNHVQKYRIPIGW